MHFHRKLSFATRNTQLHTHLHMCVCAHAASLVVLVWLPLIYWFRILLLYGINIEWLSEWVEIRHWLIVLRAFKTIWYTAGLHVAYKSKPNGERSCLYTAVLPINKNLLRLIRFKCWRLLRRDDDSLVIYLAACRSQRLQELRCSALFASR